MALTEKQKTARNFKAFYEGIRPYLNGEVPTFANAFNKSDLYSTSEKIIGCWIDGKPLYQKTYVVSNSVTTGDVSVDASLTKSNYNVISVSAIKNVGTSGDSNNIVIPYDITSIDPTYGGCASIQQNDADGLYIKIKNINANCKFYVTVRYTKSTDSAINVGDGNDYSTDEQIIGTWIDGSVLYQKTVVTGGSVPSGATLIERIVQAGYDTLRYTKSS